MLNLDPLAYTARCNQTNNCVWRFATANSDICETNSIMTVHTSITIRQNMEDACLEYEMHLLDEWLPKVIFFRNYIL